MNLSRKFPAKTLFLIIAFLVVTFFTYPIYGKEWSEVQRQILKMEERYWNFWKEEGVKYIQDYHDKEAIIFGHQTEHSQRIEQI
jgi:hypothetical protein